MSSFVLSLAGTPVGKGRPRFRILGKGAKRFVSVYTPQETVDAEERVRDAWRNAGAVRLSGPIAVSLTLYVERPAGHFRKNGALSAAGLRHPHPHKQKPDIDNAMKLIFDALNGHAWTDDVRVVAGDFERRWDDRAGTRFAAAEIAPSPTTEGD